MTDKQNKTTHYTTTNNLLMLSRILHRNLMEWEECRARINRNYDPDNVAFIYHECIRTAMNYINIIQALQAQPITLDEDKT